MKKYVLKFYNIREDEYENVETIYAKTIDEVIEKLEEKYGENYTITLKENKIIVWDESNYGVDCWIFVETF